MKKTLPVGNESFISLMENHSYYVDKTAVFKPLMESGNFVHLITRPRRFGKSLFMDTLRTFLQLNPDHPGDTSLQQRYFSDKTIFSDHAFCQRFMGQIPILFLCLKGIDKPNYERAYRAFAKKLHEHAKAHAYLLDSPRLSASDKTVFRQYLDPTFMRDVDNQDDAAAYIGDMATFLAKHFERPAVLLIDEYDVPLAKAAANGYYEDMRFFMKALLEPLEPLKTGGTPTINGVPVIRKAILTGCLRVSKASIFTDVNNFNVNSVCAQGSALAAAIGFTSEEVSELLDYYGLSEKRTIIRQWYDGYRIGGHDIYCPWDVLRFCDDILSNGVNPDTFKPANYWADTSGNEVIDEFLGFLTSEDADRMQTLMDGSSVEFKVNEQLTYDDFVHHRSDDFWTLLLFTGYLTVAAFTDAGTCLVKIPNEEIRETFRNRIQSHFSSANRTFAHGGEAFGRAAFTGDTATLQTLTCQLLERYVSVRDTATRAHAENYYHGFLMGLLGSADAVVKNLLSNREAGDGYADIVFTSLGARVGVVLEIKYCADRSQLKSSSEAALRQIHDKRYADGLAGFGCPRLFGYGLAFSGKNCVVTGAELSAEAKPN